MSTEAPIITVTDAAMHHIKTQLAAEADTQHFRLGIKRTGCSGWMYTPEVIATPQDDDIFVTTVDDVAVYVTEKSRELLQGTNVDYVEKSLGFKQMEFNNPNATSLCGCGESFQIKEQDDE